MQVKRVFPIVVAAAALLSACGDSGTAGSTTAATMGPTSFATLAPTQSTLPPTTVAGGGTAGEVTTTVTDYPIVAGDVPVNVAKKFGITLEALNNANLDTAGYSAFYVGLVIKIPAGAVLPGSTPDTTTTLGADPAATTTQPATTLAPAGGCTAGSYTIVEGDLPSRVANKFDVTLEQLDAANVNTKGYSAFIVGVKIIIPCA